MLGSFLVYLCYFLSFATLATSTTNCPPAKLCYAIDESDSISSSNFAELTDAVVSITSNFNQLSSGSSFSAVGYSSTAHVIFTLTADESAAISALQNNPKSGGFTSSGSGLNACSDILANENDPRIILLFTDGTDTVDPSGAEVQAEIKADSIIIATVGIGGKVNETVLKNIIASDPTLYTAVADFSALQTKIAEIVDSLCSDTPTPSPTSTPSKISSVTPTITITPSKSPLPTSSTPTPSKISSVTPSITITPSKSPLPTSSTPTPSKISSMTPTITISPSKSLPFAPSTPTASSAPSTTPTSSTTFTPSTALSTSPTPSTSPPPICAPVSCAGCEQVLECYVQTGFDQLDAAICNLIETDSFFCAERRGKFTKCNQQCAQQQGTVCYPGQSWATCPAFIGSPHKAAFCKGGAARGKPAALSNFASYEVCIDDEITSNRCLIDKCDSGSCACA